MNFVFLSSVVCMCFILLRRCGQVREVSRLTSRKFMCWDRRHSVALAALTRRTPGTAVWVAVHTLSSAMSLFLTQAVAVFNSTQTVDYAPNRTFRRPVAPVPDGIPEPSAQPVCLPLDSDDFLFAVGVERCRRGVLIEQRQTHSHQQNVT